MQSSGSEDEDAEATLRVGAAYNTSIYLMVGVPYVLLGGFTFLVWRGLKKNQEYLRTVNAQPSPSGEPQPPESKAEDSSG